jgi:hypothetical protein
MKDRRERTMKVYLAHSFGGKQENIDHASQVITNMYKTHGVALMKNRITLVSPLHALGLIYEIVPYDEGMRMCYELLEDCDLLVYIDNYDQSKGVHLEREYCRKMDIMVMEFDTFIQFIENN